MSRKYLKTKKARYMKKIEMYDSDDDDYQTDKLPSSVPLKRETGKQNQV